MSQNFAHFGANARLIDLPVISDPRGDLTFMEGNRHIPFEIQRVYYLYNVPVDSERGGHAHRELEQVVFALSGSFRMRIDDGTNKADVWLNNPKRGCICETWSGGKSTPSARAPSAWFSRINSMTKRTIIAITKSFSQPRAARNTLFL
jgi:WxcM-like protein